MKKAKKLKNNKNGKKPEKRLNKVLDSSISNKFLTMMIKHHILNEEK